MSETSTEQSTADGGPESEIDPAQVVPEAIHDASRNYRKVRQGYVVSDKMDKTVVVSVEDRVKHALYGKVLRRSSKVKAHDEASEAGVGDLVQIMETRPMSATKRWRVVRILDRAK
jgi:small subunit ribosomal protein S17